MELAKIIGVALVTAISAIILKAHKPELSFAVSVAGGVIILIFVIDALSTSLQIFNELASKTGIDNSLIKLILKIVAIGYLVEFSAGIIEDFGNKSVADKLVLAGKVIILTVAIPIIQSLITLIGNLLELI